jgi:hypothetical protein
MQKSYSLVQDNKLFTINDLDENVPILSILFDDPSTLKLNATFELDETKYEFTSNAWWTEFYLSQGTTRIGEIDVKLSGNYQLHLLNSDSISKYFNLNYTTLLYNKFIVKDFLTNELFSIDIDMEMTKYNIVIKEENGWLEEHNKVNKKLLLAMISYALLIYFKSSTK